MYNNSARYFPGQSLIESDKAKSIELIRVLDELNAASPETINSEFTADGKTSGKSLKLRVELYIDKKGYYFITLKDFVFRSPVIDVYRTLISCISTILLKKSLLLMMLINQFL